MVGSYNSKIPRTKTKLNKTNVFPIIQNMIHYVWKVRIDYFLQKFTCCYSTDKEISLSKDKWIHPTVNATITLNQNI